jgi:hypothetical protein
MAGRAGLTHDKEALLNAHLAAAVTGAALRRAGTLLSTGAIARLALNHGRHANLCFGTTHRFFQIQLNGVAEVGAAITALLTTTTTAAENIAEDVAKNIAKARAFFSC